MATTHYIHFVLRKPDPRKLDEIKMKPKPSSFLLEEVVKDINDIVRNAENEQLIEYVQALITFRRFKCCTYFFCTLLILITAFWITYMFVLCENMSSTLIKSNCDYMDYQNNVNIICWTLFLILFALTLIQIIYASFSFYTKSKIISKEWRECIKDEIDQNIAERRVNSPQHLFEIKYQRMDESKANKVNGLITIQKNAGSTPITTTNEHESSLTFDVSKHKKKKRASKKSKRQSAHVHVPSVSEYPSYLNEDHAENKLFGLIPESQPLNPPMIDYSNNLSHQFHSHPNTDYSQQRRQIPEYSINEYSQSQSNLNLHSQPPSGHELDQLKLYSQSQMNFVSHPQLQMGAMKDYSQSMQNLGYHQAPPPQPLIDDAIRQIMQSESMQQLPPVIKNPSDILRRNTMSGDRENPYIVDESEVDVDEYKRKRNNNKNVAYDYI